MAHFKNLELKLMFFCYYLSGALTKFQFVSDSKSDSWLTSNLLLIN